MSRRSSVSTASLVARHTLAQRGLLAATMAVTIVLAGLTAGISGYLQLSQLAHSREAFAAIPVAEATITVDVALASDAPSQAAAVESIVTRELGGAPAGVVRSLSTYPLPTFVGDEERLQTPEGGEARLVPLADASVADHARLTEGRWPVAASGDTVEAALHAEAASALGVSVGDEFLVGDGRERASVVIVGLFLPIDASDPHWAGIPGAADGVSTTAGDGTPGFGPLLVAEESMRAFGPTPTARWTIVPSVAALTPDDLPRFASASESLEDALESDDAAVPSGQARIGGELGGVASEVRAQLDSVRGVTPVAVLLIGAIGLVTLAQLARLLTLARRPEHALLRSRGASAGWLTSLGLIEAVVVGMVGGALGVAGATAVLTAGFGSADATGTSLVFGASAAAAAIVILTLAAWWDAARTARRDTVDDSGRARQAATGGATFLAVVAAAFAIWQSLLYGSPLVVDASGNRSIDPLAVLAPALGVVAAALVGLMLFGPLTALWERFAARRPRLQPSYSTRQVSRGLASWAAAFAVVSLAAGSIVIASAFESTWTSTADRAASVSVGSDARIDVARDVGRLADTFEGVDGVMATAPVMVSRMSIGDDARGEFVAVDTARLADVLVVSDIDGERVAARLDEHLVAGQGVALPSDAVEITVNASAFSEASEFEVEFPDGTIMPVTQEVRGHISTTLWMLTERGELLRVPLGFVEIASSVEAAVLSADLPVRAGTLRLVAVDHALRIESAYWNTASAPQIEVDFGDWEAVTEGGTSSTLDLTSDGPWKRPGASQSLHGVSLDASGVGFTTGTEFQRLGFRVMLFETASVPLVVTDRLATDRGVGVGDRFEVRLGTAAVPVVGEIVDTAPVLPGTLEGYGALTDLEALHTHLLSTESSHLEATTLWVRGDPVAITDAVPADATVLLLDEVAGNPVATTAQWALWLAAAGCVVLATISLAAVALTAARARRGEVVVLTAVGVPARTQGRFRVAETLAVVTTALVLGLASGALIAALTVPGLARSVIIGVPPSMATSLHFASWVGVGVVLIAAALYVAVAAGYGRAVRRQALDTDERLETR